MRANWVRTAVLSLMASVVAVACDDNPVDEGRKDAARLVANPTFAVVNAGDATSVSANTLNQFGDPTLDAVTFTPCDAKVEVQPDPTAVSIDRPDRVLVIGQTLGASCVEVSGGGQMTTVTVFVVPAGISLELPATIGIGGAGTSATLTFLDKAGSAVSGFDASQVTFSVDDASVASVDAAGVVVGIAAGTAELTATLVAAWNAPRSGKTTITVVP